jgi:hypothetical protein
MGLALVLDQECARILPSTLLLGGLLLHSSQPHLFVGPRFLKRPSFLCEPQLEDQFLEVKRKRFLESAPIDDVRRQLHGLPSTVPVPSPDQRNTFRSRLATGLFTSQAPVVGSDEDVSRRIAALKGFNAHCFRQEPKAPRRRNPGRPPKAQDRSETAESETAEPQIGYVFPSDSEWAKSDTSELDYPDSEASESESGCAPVVLPPLTYIHCLLDPGNKDRR